MLHMSIQVWRKHPTFPAQWLYGLYDFVLVTGFLATIIRSKRWPLANLTPAPGRRTRTISPYASAAFVFAALASTAPRPNVCDDGLRPSDGTGWQESYFGISEIASDLFLNHGLDKISANQK